MFLGSRIWLGRQIYGVIGNPEFPAGFRVSSNRVVKWPCEVPELEGHQFAIENTTIPVPRIYKTKTWRGHLAIEMEYFADCTTLQQCWRALSMEEKVRIVDQVSGYIRQLRAINPAPGHEGKISSTRGGACQDVRVGSSDLFGRFNDIAGFHQCLRGGIEPGGTREIFGEKVADIHLRSYDTRFTHGDLGVQNILVRDGSVVAIIDWECSGWYPEYWEYTKAHYNSILAPEFYEMLRERIPRYDAELAAERALWRVFDRPLDVPYMTRS